MTCTLGVPIPPPRRTPRARHSRSAAAVPPPPRAAGPAPGFPAAAQGNDGAVCCSSHVAVVAAQIALDVLSARRGPSSRHGIRQARFQCCVLLSCIG